MPVHFFTSDIEFSLDDSDLSRLWIESTVDSFERTTGNISIIFTSNTYLLDLNRKFLNHNYYTDVITFNYNEGDIISGDIFVSVEQVEINANELGIPFNSEIFRVMVHGVLHLLGFNDENADQRREMRIAEDTALNRLEELRDGNGI